jgi:hypothetical protein
LRRKDDFGTDAIAGDDGDKLFAIWGCIKSGTHRCLARRRSAGGAEWRRRPPVFLSENAVATRSRALAKNTHPGRGGIFDHHHYMLSRA